MKIFRTLLILVIMAVSAFLLAYHVFLPQMAARSITTGELPAYLPEKYKATIEEVHESVDEGLAELPMFMARNKLTYEELVQIIQSTSAEEVISYLNDYQHNPDMSAEEAFDRVKVLLDTKVDNPEVFREAFYEHYSKDRMQQGLKYLEGSDLPLEVNIELARKTIAEVLKQRRQEIEYQLDLIQEGSN